MTSLLPSLSRDYPAFFERNELQKAPSDRPSIVNRDNIKNVFRLSKHILATPELRRAARKIHQDYVLESYNTSPAPPLVGVELNPGPKHVTRKGHAKTSRRKENVVNISNTVPKQARARARNGTINDYQVGGGFSGIIPVSAPSSFSYMNSGNTFSMDNKAYQHTEFSPTSGSTRIYGSSLAYGSVQNSSTSFAGWLPGGGGLTNEILLSPDQLFGGTDRLVALETIYERYAIRMAKFTYIPGCATTTPNTLYMAISRDPDKSYTSATNILDLNPSVATPAWSPASLTYTNPNGVKLWDTATQNVADSTIDFQGALYFVWSAEAATTLVTGFLRVDYIVDFYSPSPVRTNPAIMAAQYESLKPKSRLELHDLISKIDLKPPSKDLISKVNHFVPSSHLKGGEEKEDFTVVEREEKSHKSSKK